MLLVVDDFQDFLTYHYIYPIGTPRFAGTIKFITLDLIIFEFCLFYLEDKLQTFSVCGLSLSSKRVKLEYREFTSFRIPPDSDSTLTSLGLISSKPRIPTRSRFTIPESNYSIKCNLTLVVMALNYVKWVDLTPKFFGINTIIVF